MRESAAPPDAGGRTNVCLVLEYCERGTLTAAAPLAAALAALAEEHAAEEDEGLYAV